MTLLISAHQKSPQSLNVEAISRLFLAFAKLVGTEWQLSSTANAFLCPFLNDPTFLPGLLNSDLPVKLIGLLSVGLGCAEAEWALRTLFIETCDEGLSAVNCEAIFSAFDMFIRQNKAFVRLSRICVALLEKLPKSPATEKIDAVARQRIAARSIVASQRN
jgi:hypothetical protein